MKIQAKLRLKLMESVAVTAGEAIVGVRYNLPNSVLMKMVVMMMTRETASQRYMTDQMMKVKPAGVMKS